MDAIDLARRLLARIDAEAARIGTTILSGSMPDHTAYRRCTGQRDGLLQARGLLVELLGERKGELDIGA